MVDVVGLRFVAEGQREAVAAIKAYGDAQAKLSREIIAGATRIQGVSSNWDRLNKLLQQGTITVGAHRDAQIRLAREYAVLNNMVTASGAINTRKALSELRAAEATARNAEAVRLAAVAAEEQARANDRAAQGYARLQASINPAIAAQQRMRQAHDTVRAALNAEIITRDEAARTLREYRNATMQMGNAQVYAQRSMGAVGMGVQQVGYQVGDFLVQIQGGTNAMVAFGQQATQLVGVLPMFHEQLGISVGRLIGLSAVLGITIPLATAIGAAFMRTRAATEDARSAAERYTAQLQGVSDALRTIEGADIARMGRDFAESALQARVEFEGILRIVQQVAAEQLAQTLREPLEAIFDEIRAYERRVANLRRFGPLDGSVETPAANILGFEDLNRVVQAVEILNSLQRGTREEMQAQLAVIERQLRGSGLLTDEVAALLAGYAATLGVVESVRDGTAETTENEIARSRALAEHIQLFYDMRAAQEEDAAARDEAVQRINDALMEETRALLARQAIAENMLQYGEDSAELAALLAGLAREAYMAEQTAADIKGKNLETLMAQYDATVAAEAANDGLLQASQAITLQQARTLAEAGMLPGAFSAAAAAAMGIAGALSEAVRQAIILRATQNDFRVANAALGEDERGSQADARASARQYNTEQGIARANERLREQLRVINDVGGAASQAGGAIEEQTQSLEDFVSEMERRILLERELLTLTGAARREAEIRQDLEQRLASEGIAYTEEAIAAAAARLASQEDINQRITEQQDAMQSLADDLGGVFADFFDSGFRDFESFTDGILGVFQKMLVEMAAEAASAQIMRFLMGGGGSVAGGVTAGVAASGGGMMGTLSTVAGTAGAMTGLGGAIAGLAGPAAIAIGLFSIFRARQQRRNQEDKKESDERYRLETRLLELQGRTRELQRREIAALQPGNRALGRRIQLLEQQAAIDAQRAGLEGQLLELQGNVAEIRRRELAALDESNRALQEHIYMLEDQAIAAANAAAVQQERMTLEEQRLTLLGREDLLREMQLDGLDASNHALQEEIWLLEDQVAAAEERNSLEDQWLELNGYTNALRARELKEMDASNRLLQIRIWRLQDQQEIEDERLGLEKELLGLQGDTAALRALELAELDKSNQALQEEIWRLEDLAAAEEEAARIADERATLERQLLELQGDTNALRALDLAALDASNRALQEQIWALEDAAAAAEEAARVADERTQLERRLLEVQGDTLALRALDLAALDASNRALQEQIWALEDAQAIAEERAGLERQLLELQGDTNALRALELAALDESNRALQMQIWALEDLKRVLDDIDMNDFVSLVDYNRAVARASAEILGGSANLNAAPASVSTIPMPPVTVSTPTTTAGGTTNLNTADTQIRDAVRYLTGITQQLLTKIDNNTRRSSNILTVWDEDGLPEERVA